MVNRVNPYKVGDPHPSADDRRIEPWMPDGWLTPDKERALAEGAEKRRRDRENAVARPPATRSRHGDSMVCPRLMVAAAGLAIAVIALALWWPVK